MNHRETTHAERVVIVERHQAGETLAAIAASLHLSRFTVRHWWRAYRDGGWAALVPPPKGPPVVGPLGHFDPLVKYVALRLKRKHPAWGPAMLRLHMSRRASLQGLPLPQNTALWSYLHQFRDRLLAPRQPRTRRPATAVVRAVRPHQCWEMDFQGELPIAGCQCVISPLALHDEASGAPLARCIHAVKAIGNRQGLTMRHVQADLRQVFTHWGLPDAVRMDRDALFVGSSRLEWPGTLLLWLVGLAVQPLINRAYRPTDNAMVERSHRTWQGDVVTGVSFPNLEALQQASDQALIDRQLYLPSGHASCQGQAPATVYPDLLQPRRPYQPAQERALFDLGRVDAYLAEWEWQRLVDHDGKISLANRSHRVSKAHCGQVIKVRFDIASRELVCTSVAQEELARLQLVEFSLDYILGEGV